MNEETLFQEALSLPTEGRANFLEQACVGRPELLASVRALLDAHERSSNVLDRTPLGRLAKITYPIPACGMIV